MNQGRPSYPDCASQGPSQRADAAPIEPSRGVRFAADRTQTELRPGVSIGPYRLIEPAGAGGMAEVWRAYDARLERYVAIKFLSSRHATDPTYLDRFLHEARAVSRLDHANVLTVLDYGEQGGWTYMVSPFVGGGTLAARLHRGPWTIPETVAVLEQLAAALDHAHAAGIIHRDVKPSNVLFNEHGRLVLSDFGVARMVEGTTALSQAGLIIGTPMYMSPEQADGEKAGPASDLYSLGVVAYQMLTGRPPFMADTPLALLRAHIDRPLQPPRTLNPRLSETVEAALFKVMAKGPADRYASAADFVRALQAEAPTGAATQATITGPGYPSYRSDVARPNGQHTGSGQFAGGVRDYPSGQFRAPSPLTPPPYTPGPHTPPPTVPPPPQRGLGGATTRTAAPVKKTRRQAIVALGGLVVAAVGGGVGVWAMSQRGDTPAPAASAVSSATYPTPRPTMTPLPPLPLLGASEPTPAAAPTSTVAAQPTEAPAVAAAPAAPTVAPNPPTAVPTTELTAAPTEAVAVANAPATPAAPSADQTAMRVLAAHTGGVTSVAYSPGGQVLASGSFDQTVRLWSVADGAPIGTLSGHTNVVVCVAFSPDGQVLASGSVDQSVRLWNVADGTPIRVMSGHTDTIIGLTFSPDGQLLVSGSSDKTVQIWRVADGAPVRTLNGHAADVYDVTFSPDGQLIASASWDGTIRVWRVSDGKSVRTLFGHDGPITGVAFSPDGRLLASSSADNTLRLWRVADWLRIRTLRGHTAQVNSVGFSPDGQVLVSASADRTVRLWRTSDGGPLQTLSGHADAVSSARFAPSGQLIASGSSDLTVRLWRVP